MVCYKASASALLLLLSPTGAATKKTKKLKLHAAANNSGQIGSLFTSFLQYLKLQEPIFVPAITLDEFANVDPEQFEWIDKSEIEAGGTTCGFLKAELGALPDVEYPRVNVYVCVMFAKNQPAPRGNLAVHCGGPGSLSSCVYYMGYLDAGQDNVDNYNIIGFDQRGMGRSTPTFMVPECAVKTHDPDGSIMLALDFTEPSTIQASAEVYKKRSLKCWNHPDFKIPFEDSTGIIKNYHFLEYSGTRQLAEDIERVRILFGKQKLSIYGISYGTKVFGTYATMFPGNVNLMVLDGNVDPGVDIEGLLHDVVKSRNNRIEYFISACERNPKLCPVKSMRHCVTTVYDLIKVEADLVSNYGFTVPSFMMIIIQLLYQDFDMAPDLCETAESGDVARFFEMLFGSGRSIFGEFPVINIGYGNLTFNTESTPTDESDESANSWPFEGYKNLHDLGVALMNVAAQDYYYGAYDEDTFVNFLFDLNKRYPGAGTQTPLLSFAGWYGACYQAPRITPTPPLGNPYVGGIVAGQLYDPATPYIMTQRMRENFPSTYLLTSRSVNHGLGSAKELNSKDPTCQSHIVEYLKTGNVGFHDGTVCESDAVKDSCSIYEVVSGSNCF